MQNNENSYGNLDMLNYLHKCEDYDNSDDYDECPICPPGPPGVKGPPGPQGPQGPEGITRIPGYAYIFNVGSQTVGLEDDIKFSSNGVIAGSIFHTPGEANISLTVAGTYVIWFYVYAYQPNQFTLFKSGEAVNAAIYGSGSPSQSNSGMVIIKSYGNDSITIRNHISVGDIILPEASGGNLSNVNASILILKIN